MALIAMAVVLMTCIRPAVAQDEGDGQIALVVQFLGEADAEMRAVGLQYVRDEVPGEAATKQFAAMLPDLKPDAQAELLDALGDRGDSAALPAVLDMVDSDEPNVRAAAVEAVGSLGGAEQVPLLGRIAAGDEPAAAVAAYDALIRLKGDGVDDAILGAIDGASPELHAAMIRALAGRDAESSLPGVLEATGAEASVVRLAALEAARRLATADDAAALVEVVADAPNDTERRKAQLALLTVCSRGREQCAGAIVAAVGDASPVVQVALLPTLARSGGSEALEAVVALTGSVDPRVKSEAISTLAKWPSRDAIDPLEELAATDEPTPEQIVALRGLVRVAGAAEDEPADVDTLSSALELARRPAQRRFVVAALGRAGTVEAIEQIVPLLDDPDLREEAAAAIVVAAEQLDDPAKRDAALKKVVDTTENELTRQRAEKLRKAK